MSDSDNDLSDNVFTFRNEGSIVSANGPNININNVKGLSFRNNDLTSTMNMHSNMSRNYEWQRGPGSNYNQMSMRGRRETSPMSTASACDVRQRNYNNLNNSKALSSQRLNSGRARSPTMSLRSIDSNASNFSADDLAKAIKNFRGSNHEMKRIQEACKLFMKHNTRRGIEKRRNLRTFLKGYRRKSGNDSGELGSNSSISDDDRSTRCRSTKTDIADIRRNIKDTNMYRDCTNNFRQNKMLAVNGSNKLNSIRSTVSPSRSKIEKPTIPKSLHTPFTNLNLTLTHNQSSMNQSKCYKDQMRSRFILPSQRFNQSVAATSIPEISSRRPLPQEQMSDDDEIFSESTTRETSDLRKRVLDGNDDILCLPNNKKPKVQKDFEFAKPAFPVRKVANVKSKEIIISTSTKMNPTEALISKSASQPPNDNNSGHEDEKEDNTELQTTSQNNTDVSMRPSFMKRKLFSQKMDVTEKINDIANSPQNSVYGKIQKEKNKARKLVTSQYCLSRDIERDENNLLDLIHKIVPAECMNATQINKTTTQNKPEDKVNGDVTSMISTGNNNEEDLSDTFTDEDAFLTCNGEVSSPKTVKKVFKSPLKNVRKSPQKPLLDKSPVKKMQKSPCKVSKLPKNVLAEKNGTPTKRVEKMDKYIKSFWDTDFESDVEFTPASRKEIEKAFKENKTTDAALSVAYKSTFNSISSVNPVNNAVMMNTTVDSTQKFNNTNSIFNLCSHRNTKPKKFACEKVNETITQIRPINSEHKNTKSNPRLENNTELESNTQLVNKKAVKPKLDKTKPEKKKSPPKKQSKAKSVKNNTTNTPKEKESKIINSTHDKILGEENTKSQKQNSKNVKTLGEDNTKSQKKNNKNDKTLGEENAKSQKNYNINDKTLSEQNTRKKNIKNVQSKTERKDEQIGQDKKIIKKGATAAQNNIENNRNKTRHDKDSLNSIKEKTTGRKPDLNIKDKTINNKKNMTKLSDSLIYEDSFNETNNNSVRPVRSCRLSKQNNSLDTNKVNQTLNVTLRPRQKKTDEKNTAVKRSKSKEQANLSDLSFLVAQKKSIFSNKKLKETKKIDNSDSDISFSLTDKDSHLKSRGKSATFIKHAEIRTNRKMPLRTPNKNEFISRELRPVRTRISNRRYFS